MTIILSIAIALVAGLISTRIVKLLHLPNVTGYLVNHWTILFEIVK